MIENEAAIAVKAAREKSFKPFTYNGPVTARIMFSRPAMADAVENLDGVKRLDGRNIEVTASNFINAFELVMALHFLGPVIK